MWDFLWGVAGFLLTIGLLVTIHEYGHFWMARRFGVKIIRFSLGFGKPLLSWTGKKEGTQYTLSPIPLGGFVQMYGEQEDETLPPAERAKTFYAKAPWQRFLIAFAGPAVNLIFAVLAFALLFFTGVKGMEPQIALVRDGSIADRAGLQAGDRILSVNGSTVRLAMDAHVAWVGAPRDTVRVEYQRDGQTRDTQMNFSTLKAGDELKMGNAIGLYLVDEWLPADIDKVLDDTPAAHMGLRAGDRILTLNGEASDLIRIGEYIAAHPHSDVQFRVLRDGQEIDISGKTGEREGRGGKTGGWLGVQWQLADLSAHRTVERYGIIDSLQRGMEKTAHYVKLTFAMFGRMIKGEVSLDNLGGPITIGDTAGKTLQFGWDVFLNFLGVVSLSLAALNLLPVPMLDGGHMLFYAVETLRGKPLSDMAMKWAYRVGQFVLFSFIGFVLLNDFYRYLF
ncbi:MAG: RIP metalloprotease RseP [Cardiobacteriaceae bacterium]|nr:RIP metalloprotease RseP [Cardiobacteriaceae bacterium]